MPKMMSEIPGKQSITSLLTVASTVFDSGGSRIKLGSGLFFAPLSSSHHTSWASHGSTHTKGSHNDLLSAGVPGSSPIPTPGSPLTP